jgi:hypothetical protein
MYEKNHPVYPELEKIGKEITQKVKPKAIVIFSAHWQGERDVIEINTSENTDLIYEYLPPAPSVRVHHLHSTAFTASHHITIRRRSLIRVLQQWPKK